MQNPRTKLLYKFKHIS